MKKQVKFKPIEFELHIDGRPMEVVAKPYLNARDERRFRVSVGGSPVHIFALNERERRIEMLDTPSNPIPMHVQHAVAEKLLTKLAA